MKASSRGFAGDGDVPTSKAWFSRLRSGVRRGKSLCVTGFFGGAPGTYHMLIACSPIEAFLCPDMLKHPIVVHLAGDQNDDSW